MRPYIVQSLCTVLLSVPLAPIAGCALDDTTIAPVETGDAEVAGGDFEAVRRSVPTAEIALRKAALADVRKVSAQVADDSFYLAVKKSALGERFFLSGYLEQYFPGAVNEGAATTLGTRVVSFRIQNGRLYLFDVSDGTASSDVFDPDLIVDAFPIVEERELRTERGRERYVLIDPAAGLNRFNLVSDSFATAGGLLAPSAATRFEIELAFSQSFRAIADGATWQLVFTGYGDRPLEDVDSDAPPAAPLEPNQLRASGTLGMSLRRYRESEGYQPLPMATEGTDLEHEFFFRGPARLAPNSGQIEQVAAHWAIFPGMKPIEWVISSDFVAIDNSPEFADVDLVDTIEAGIENWNQAFGFRALEARVARPGEQFGQDDKNFLIFDPSPELSFAFADWRTNPSTGETRGASVYLGATFLDRSPFQDEAAAANAHPHGGARRVALAWDGLPSSRLCEYKAPDRGVRGAAAAGDLSGAEQFERSLGGLVLHEIGHTLGLRHNFKGSLVPPTSSVMDYTLLREAIAQGPVPGSYDIAAVRFLYGLSPDAPTQPFCTDEQLSTSIYDDGAGAQAVDGACQQFDRGARPLGDFHVDDYGFFTGLMLDGEEPPSFFDDVLEGLFVYGRLGDEAQANLTWQTAIADVGAPVDPARREDPTFVAAANDLTARIFDALGVNHHPSIEKPIIEQAQLVARNVDGIRPAALRRSMIDTLKRMQTIDGFEGLRTLRAELAAALTAGGLDRVEELTAVDLVDRIDRATRPYFD
jgi:hypothetical protein